MPSLCLVHAIAPIIGELLWQFRQHRLVLSALLISIFTPSSHQNFSKRATTFGVFVGVSNSCNRDEALFFIMLGRQVMGLYEPIDGVLAKERDAEGFREDEDLDCELGVIPGGRVHKVVVHQRLKLLAAPPRAGLVTSTSFTHGGDSVNRAHRSFFVSLLP
jgi:hypothetical protein